MLFFPPSPVSRIFILSSFSVSVNECWLCPRGILPFPSLRLMAAPPSLFLCPMLFLPWSLSSSPSLCCQPLRVFLYPLFNSSLLSRHLHNAYGAIEVHSSIPPHTIPQLLEQLYLLCFWLRFRGINIVFEKGHSFWIKKIASDLC